MIYELLQLDLIEELGLQDESPAVKQQILDRAGKVISERILLRGMMFLPEEIVAKLDEIKTGEGVMKVMQTYVPNFNLLAQEEIANFKAELISLTAEV